MTKYKRYRHEKLECGICGHPGCNRRREANKCLCSKHLKSERERARRNYQKNKQPPIDCYQI